MATELVLRQPPVYEVPYLPPNHPDRDMRLPIGLPGIKDDMSYQLPPDLAIEDWEEIGGTLQQMEKSVGWWIGDWWRHGVHKWGQMASQGAKDHLRDRTGHAYDTIRHAAKTAAAFPPERRNPDVSYTHHVEASSLPPEDADDLMKIAAEAGMSKLVFRQAVKRRQAEVNYRNVAALPATTAILDDTITAVADARQMPLADSSVDLIITSPPYALEIGYDGGDVRADDWWRFMLDWLREAYRVLKPNGRLALNVPLDTTLGGRRPTYAQAVAATQAARFKYRTTVTWHDTQLGKSTARGSQDSAAAINIVSPTETIILAFKGEWGRETPWDRPSDLSHEGWIEWTNGDWTFPGESSPWEFHPAPFPMELPKRLVYLLSFPGDTILDPFCGSATALLAARNAQRKAIGLDRSGVYIASGRRRLAKGAPRE